MNRTQSSVVALVMLLGIAWFGNVVAQTPSSQKKSAPAMERTEHEWKGAERSSTFDALWSGAELKMIREEMTAGAGMIEKNEYFFNAGTLLHYKQDRYPVSGKSGAAEAVMVSFDKTGKPSISMKRVDGKPAGPASPGEIERAKKHLAELLAIAGKVKH